MERLKCKELQGVGATKCGIGKPRDIPKNTITYLMYHDSKESAITPFAKK